jgi:accessory colonization factor AcfC
MLIMIFNLSWMIALLLSAGMAWGSVVETTKTLLVYGPGGPHHVIQECASLFQERHGVNVAVIKALPMELEQRLSTDGDIYFGGAEYMLEEFASRNPGVLDMLSVERLHPRRIGIIVRKGNPHLIAGMDDLTQEGVELLDVKLENMRYFHAKTSLLGNIRRIEYTGKQGLSAWRSTPEIDAWVTYKSWHFELEEESEFIELPGNGGLRYTPMALTHRTPHRQEALQFISFLKSAEAKQIFIEHGWY